MRSRRLIPAILFIFFLVGCFDYEKYKIVYEPEQVSFAETADGWKLVVYHLPPTVEPLDADPIIMCHGLTSTSATFDQGNGNGFGPYMASLGYDVWMVNMRGREPGTIPGDGSGKHYGWTVDDVIHLDVPAMIAHVCAKTEKKKVTWVGHSMGGMVMYAYLGTTHDDRIAKLIIFSSPVYFKDYDPEIIKLARRANNIFKKDSVLKIRRLARMGIPLENRELLAKFIYLAANLENIDTEIWKRYLYNGVEDVSGGVVQQTSQWALRERFLNADGTLDYTEKMKNITLPLLVMTGSADYLGAPKAVSPALEYVGSQDKNYREFGVATGCKTNYGHLDILTGMKCREEIFPTVTKWLSEHQ